MENSSMIHLKELQSNNLVSVPDIDLNEVKGGAVGFVSGLAVGTFRTASAAWFNPGTNWGQHFTDIVGTTVIGTGLGAAFGGPKGAALSD
jgi:hypothetical protein